MAAMENSRLLHLFDKYMEGSCTPAELRELVDLLQEAEAADALDQPMEALWQQLKNEQPANTVDWNAMYNVISNQPEELQPYHYKSPFKRYWYYAAAAVVIAVASIIAFNQFSSKTPGKNPVLAEVRKDSIKHANTRQTIHLPDGSTVILNSNSKLDYPAQFTGNTREVHMTGEAYFDIAHNPAQPFIVHAGNISTKVLGTTFNIKAYPSDDNILVTVVKGKVQVSKKNKTLGTLTASQQISFTKSTEAVVQQQANTKVVTAWKPAEVVFNDMTMREAVEQLKKRFNLNIVFANDAIKNCKVTATFSEDDLPEEILTVLCGVSNSNFSTLNNTITIDGKGCN